MELRPRPSLLPQCWSCARRSVNVGTVGWKQTRGLNKLGTYPGVVAVQLQKPLDGYGKPGTFVPISAGKMRNIWFPTKIARYAVGEEVNAIKAGKITMERDYAFKVDEWLRKKQKALQKALEEEKARREEAGDMKQQMEDLSTRAIEHEPVQIEAMDAQRSIDLIGVLLPPKMEFFRAVQGHLVGSSAVPIYGSVTTADIATSIKALLAHNDEAARITLSENNIKFVDVADSDDHTRAKHLGDYTIEISVKGTESQVRRKVQVIAEGEQQDG